MSQQRETYVIDSETNGLLDVVDRVHVIVALSVETGREVIFSDNDLSWVTDAETRRLDEFNGFLQTRVKAKIGQNYIGYDMAVFEKILGITEEDLESVMDTMLMSQTLNYHRFGAFGGHSMEVWGKFLGYPKQEHEDWSTFTPEMLERCRSDCQINLKMFQFLIKELKSVAKINPLITKSLRAEHYAAWFAMRCELDGYPFDIEAAHKVEEALLKEIDATKALVEPMIRSRLVIIDKEPRKPAFTKAGHYYQWVCNQFPGLLPDDIDDPSAPLQVVGPYQRFEYQPVSLGNLDHVKEFLATIGWEPDTWNYKRNPETGKLEKTSSKLTESSLEPLGEIGEKLNRFYTLRARHGILKGLIEAYRNGRVHGRCFTIGTPTGRARHSLVVNIPSAGALFGKEMRSLFTAPPGMVQIGADSAGNQLRGLCHELNNPEYTHEVINGDVHTANTKILQEVYPPAVRGNGKKFIYAFLFGAGGGKLAFDLTGKRDNNLGNRLKETFTERVVGLGPLIKGLEAEYNENLRKFGVGFIRAIDGRPVFPDQKRKTLNYRLQSTEGITCKCAIMWFVREMKKRYPGVRWKPQIFMHDEIQIAVDASLAEEVAALAKLAFKEGPKEVGVMIMDGDAKIGANWYDTH